MSTAQIYLTCDNTTNAFFRQWGGGLSAQLDTMGWTKTSDTGQVNWATVVLGSGFVYEIRRPASDPLQTGATAYYIKIEYLSTTNTPGFQLSMGTGTNGAGVLTGFVCGPWTGWNSTYNTGVTVLECDFSWDNSRLGVLMWRTATSVEITYFGAERTKDSSGVDTSEGVTLLFGGGTSQGQQRTIIFGVGAAPDTNGVGWHCIDPAGFSGAFNSNVPISPVFPTYGKYGNPMTIFATMRTSDIPGNGVLLTTTLYGATRTFLCISGLYSVVSTTSFPIMRFD